MAIRVADEIVEHYQIDQFDTICQRFFAFLYHIETSLVSWPALLFIFQPVGRTRSLAEVLLMNASYGVIFVYIPIISFN